MRRIAVIEDSETLAAAVAARLRAEGSDVRTAADGPGAVELCRRWEPDALVLDGGRSALPRAVIAVTAVAWLALVALNPDAMIARHDVDRYERTGKLDLAYARGLSADAVPALAALPPRVANVARARARPILRRKVSRCSP